jgi:cullin 3
MLMDVGEDVYVHDFETHLLRATTEFYKSESEALLASCDCYAYLRRAEQRLEEEHARVGSYLCARTEAFLVRRAEQELLERPTRRVLGLPNSGLRAMLAEGRVAQAALAYKLYARVEGGLAFVKQVFAEHALEEGKKLVHDPDLNADPVRYVESALSLKRSLDATAKEAFRRDRGFLNASARGVRDVPEPELAVSRVFVAVRGRQAAQGAQGRVRGGDGGHAGRRGVAVPVPAGEGRV